MQKSIRMIILKRMKWSEADLIIHGLQPTGERIHCLARAALKSRKRFGGGILEPSHYIEGQVKLSNKVDGLHNLEDARLVESFPGLREDYDRLSLGLRFLDVIDRSNPGEVFPEIFNLLGNALKALAQGGHLERVEIQFGLKFLKLHGVLEMDAWMAPFLEKPLVLPDPGQSLGETHPGRRQWLSEQLKIYIQNASL